MGMAENIRKRRLELGMTQEELAVKIGVQKSAVAKYESGRVKNIKRAMIATMAKALECDPVWLMDLHDDDDQGYAVQLSHIENEIMQIVFKLTEENKKILLKQARFLLFEQEQGG